MFGLGTAEIVGSVAVLFLAEVALLWAATALIEVPGLSWRKLAVVVLVVIGLSLAGTVGIAVWSGLGSPPLAPENRMHAVLVSVAGLGVSLLVSAALYPPLLSISLGRSALLAVLQVLLRALLYALLIAAVMVILALIQIYTGADVRAGLTVRGA
ncbi:MAG: hypothetical protein U0736_05425 [Gemmataceae bacterium]